MRGFLWRCLYAALCVVMFWWVFPLFLAAIGYSPGGPLMALLRAVIICIAVLYALFGKEPPAPF